MIRFNQYNAEIKMITESNDHVLELLTEVSIQLGGQKDTRFNQVVILAGGAGSGKGFILNNLIDIQGVVFDVDALKSIAIRTPKINAKVKSEFGVDLLKLKLKNPEDVRKLHAIVADLGLAKSKASAISKSILTSDATRKPNLIFDVTLKSLKKLDDISNMVTKLGYDKKNIHVIWILNDIDVAIKQNNSRERKVPADILTDTHDMVSRLMSKILKGKIDIQKYIDGFFIIVPNKANVDSQVKSSIFGGLFFKAAEYIVVKKKCNRIKTISKLSDELVSKIKGYVPNPIDWI